MGICVLAAVAAGLILPSSAKSNNGVAQAGDDISKGSGLFQTAPQSASARQSADVTTRKNNASHFTYISTSVPSRRSSSAERATFVALIQTHSPESNHLLREALISSHDPTFQSWGVSVLGVMQGGDASSILLALYQSHPKRSVREAIATVFFTNGDYCNLQLLLDEEKEEELRAQVASLIGLMRTAPNCTR